MVMRRLRISALPLCVLALLGAACGDASQPSDPATLLRQAKQVLDGTQSAHFQLTGSQIQAAGTYVTGGTGDMRRPNAFAGSLDVTAEGFQISIRVVSVNHVLYVNLPTSPGFQVTDPASYGFGDPSQLLDPNKGLSNLLVICAHPTYANDDRVNGELLHEVACTLPGTAIKALLTDAAPDRPVQATMGIAASNDQLRRVVLTGPFFSATTNSTFTLLVDSYGENVTITPPPSPGA
jgi:lipoprotein LprG